MKILSICGSPRKGNSETILLYLKKYFKSKGVDNEVVLLSQSNIERCHGCVEFCNHKHVCRIKDDMPAIINKIIKADALVFISPNYFQMPPGIFKDFMDRSNVIFYQATDKELKSKKTIIISLGTDKPEESLVCAQNIANLYCRYVGNVVGTKSFQSRSELNGNYNDIFTNGLNPNIETDLKTLANLLLI